MSSAEVMSGRPEPPRTPTDVFDLSIVIPAYNEEQRIVPTLRAIAAYLQMRALRSEVLVVDDGSSDGTVSAVESLKGVVPGLRLLRNPGNRGKGFSIRHGFKECRGRQVLLTDADLSTPIEEIQKLSSTLEGGKFGGAIGSRALESSSVEVPQGWVRRTMGKTFNRLVRLLTGLPFKDTQCGFKLLDRARFDPVFRAARIDRFSYDVELLMLATRHGIPVAEVPVIWRNSPQSKVHFIRDSFQMLGDITSLAIRERFGSQRGNP